MTTSTNIHDVTTVTAGSVHYSNSNAVTLRFATKDFRGEGQHELTLFGLPTEAAEHISRSLAYGSVHQSEADIRADERAKVTARLAALIGEAA